MLTMSAINGVYRHESSNTTLTLEEGDDSHGTCSGTLSLAGIEYPLGFANYHFKHGLSSGPVAISFSVGFASGMAQAWVLFSADQRYTRLRAMGTDVANNGNVGLTAREFIRQTP
jgi:hypothetical protein